MNTINIIVQNKIACLLDMNSFLVCGNNDYVIDFSFDAEWDGYDAKTARFVWGGQYVDVVFTGNQCPAPVILDTKAVAVGVYAGDLATTTPANIRCISSIRCGKDAAPKDPTPEVYDQIMELVNKCIKDSSGTDEERVREIVAEETADLVAESDRDEFVKGGLTDNALSMSDEEKAKACDFVGALKKETKSTTRNQVYVKLSNGENKMYDMSDTAHAYTIAYRTANARLIVGMCEKENDATPKKYVDGKADELSTELAVINTVLEQSGLVSKYKATIEDTYTERVTADGANVLDGSKAKLEKVVGSTVKSQNLFDGTLLSGYYQDANFTLEAGGSNIFKSLRLKLPAGKYRISFSVPIVFVRTIVNGVFAQSGDYTLSTNGGEVGVSFRAEDRTDWKEEYKVWITEGEEEKPYTPYFTGLKSASFAGIESTNADGTETATLDFPKTETPLGVTIDFERKKITDYGVDLVLTGTENCAYYSGFSVNGMSFSNVMPYGEDKAVGICTDATVGWGVNRLSVGLNNQNLLLWVGVFDTLGFTTAGDKPTSEEQATLVTKFRAWLAQRYADGNPVTIRYVSSVLQSETDFTADNEYTAYKGGTEKVLDNDGKDYGADNTLSQNYIIVTGVK